MELKKSYKCVKSLEQFYSEGPYVVASDGSFMVCACNETLKLVDLSSSMITSSIEGDSEPVTALALNPNSNNILFSASHSRLIRVWDLSTLKCLRSWKGHEGPVIGMACDASSGWLATSGAGGKVHVWDVDGGFCTHQFQGHKGVVTTVMFHPHPDRLQLQQLAYSYRTLGLGKLEQLKIDNFHCSRTEMLFVRSILSSAPLLLLLKTILNEDADSVPESQSLKISKELTGFSRASPKLEIICEPSKIRREVLY